MKFLFAMLLCLSLLIGCGQSAPEKTIVPESTEETKKDEKSFDPMKDFTKSSEVAPAYDKPPKLNDPNSTSPKKSSE